MKQDVIHTCKDKPTEVDIEHLATGWFLLRERYHGESIYLISYCPYCGDRLTTTADTHIKE
jgi:hypothetical protein